MNKQYDMSSYTRVTPELCTFEGQPVEEVALPIVGRCYTYRLDNDDGHGTLMSVDSQEQTCVMSWTTKGRRLTITMPLCVLQHAYKII
jgi:hypothetical protein